MSVVIRRLIGLGDVAGRGRNQRARYRTAVQLNCGACDLTSDSHVCFVARGYPIVRCSRCGTLQTHLGGARLEPADLYSRAYFEGGQDLSYAGYAASASILEYEFERSLTLLRRWVPGGHLLEVGAAYGMFLKRASRCFEVCGLEVSSHAAEQGRRNGVDVRIVDLCAEEAPAVEGPWDAVAMFDTIEHLTRPLRALRRLRNVLRPGGGLILTTGDVGTPVARYFGAQWRLMTPPEHLFFFDRPSMIRLLRATGFEVVWFDRPWKFVPIGLVMHRLLRRWMPDGCLARRFAGYGIPLNLFDTMRIVAVAGSTS